MKITKTICSQCPKEIVTTADYTPPEKYPVFWLRLSLEADRDGDPISTPYFDLPISIDQHFCSGSCLREWVLSQIP
jgi:hypothetical protein